MILRKFNTLLLLLATMTLPAAAQREPSDIDDWTLNTSFGQNGANLTIDGYSQWDLNVKHSVSLRQFILEPGVGIENLFNMRDTAPWNSNYSTINPGRSFLVSLTLRFHDASGNTSK